MMETAVEVQEVLTHLKTVEAFEAE